VLILNSTLEGNLGLAGFGAAIFNNGDRLEIGSSIVSGSPSISSTSDFPGTSLGYNLFSDDGGRLMPTTGDRVNTDPMLGPLQDNGGPTFTHALLCGSPAIDLGKNFSASATDQRGLPRSVEDPFVVNAARGDGTDIGAFEVQGGDCGSPAKQLSHLIALVQAFSLHPGTGISLTVKLKAAADALGRGDTRAACGSLRALLNEVNAQSGKKLTAGRADLLIVQTTAIQTALNCQ